jgi:signal transduction histidine kinase
MSVRLRFTFLYGAMFLLCALGLLAIVAAISLNNTVSAGPVGSVSAAQQAAQLQRQLADADAAHTRQLLFGLIAALAVTLVFALVLGRAAAGRVVRPLRQLTAATRRISADNLHERLAVRGPSDEVKALADTIDDLLSRLEESFAAQRRFVADASHELRTPLTTIRATLDVTVAKPGPLPAQTVQLAERVRDSLDEVDVLLEGLLVLARAQHGAVENRAEVCLSRLAEEALQDQSQDLEVYDDIDDDVMTRGNPVLLARLTSNVIDNAFRHNIPGGWVGVATSADRGRVRLVVESSGPALDPEQVRRLGQPFHRLRADRTGGGTGLGLSIVAAVAAAHGGTLTLTARDEGGLHVMVELPA